MIPKDNKKVKLSKYTVPCESVYDFMDLLLRSKKYRGFQEELIAQWTIDEIDYNILLKTMHRYSKDKRWRVKVLKIIKQLEVK